MRAVVSRADGVVRAVTDAALPEAAAGQAIVAVRLGGLSTADASGPVARTAEPMVLGREAVGVVQSVERGDSPTGVPVGAKDSKRLVGKRVVIWPFVVCGRCERCRAGLSQHCKDRRVVGCLAERVAVPVANLVELPAAVTDESAILVVALARAMQVRHLVRTTQPRQAAFVTVIGESLLSLLTAQSLSKVAPTVRVIGLGQEAGTRPRDVEGSSAAARLLERWSIKHRHATDAGQRQDQSLVVECTGTLAGFRLALQYVQPRGTIILNSPGPAATSSHPTNMTAHDLAAIVMGELQVIGSGDGSAAEAVQAIAGSMYDLEGLIGRRVRIEHVPELLLNIKREPFASQGMIDGPLKVAVEF